MCVVRCSQGGCPSTFLAYLIIFLIWEAAPWTNIVLFVLSRAKVVFFVWILDLPKIWAGYILLAGVETRPPGKANGSLFSGRLFGLATPLAGIEPSPSRKTRRPSFLGGLGWAIILHRCMFLCSVRQNWTAGNIATHHRLIVADVTLYQRHTFSISNTFVQFRRVVLRTKRLTTWSIWWCASMNRSESTHPLWGIVCALSTFVWYFY